MNTENAVINAENTVTNAENDVTNAENSVTNAKNAVTNAENIVTCGLCFHHCTLRDGQSGFCRARASRNGKIISVNYGQITSIALDPIEKKPLRRFYPGSMILSVGSFGCNLRCPFCQNHEISMAGEGNLPVLRLSPDELAQQAEIMKPRGNIGIAFTYNEPLIGYEYVYETAVQVRRRGMVNVLVTNGTITEEPLRKLLPLIDAANIDLKGFTEQWYRKLGGNLESVKHSIAVAAEQCHVEVTTLLVPGENDSEEEIRALSGWLAGIDRKIPLHLSRYFPRYRMTDKGPLSVERVRILAQAARESLDYVYLGNC